MFQANVGSLDRVLRVIVGIALLALFFVYPAAGWRYWTLIGIISLVTGLVGTCPLYSVLGLSTRAARKT